MVVLTDLRAQLRVEMAEEILQLRLETQDKIQWMRMETQDKVQRLEETIATLRTEIASLKTLPESGKINHLAYSVADAMPDI